MTRYLLPQGTLQAESGEEGLEALPWALEVLPSGEEESEAQVMVDGALEVQHSCSPASVGSNTLHLLGGRCWHHSS